MFACEFAFCVAFLGRYFRFSLWFRRRRNRNASVCCCCCCMLLLLLCLCVGLFQFYVTDIVVGLSHSKAAHTAGTRTTLTPCYLEVYASQILPCIYNSDDRRLSLLKVEQDHRMMEPSNDATVRPICESLVTPGARRRS